MGIIVDLDYEEIIKVKAQIKCVCGSNVHWQDREIAEYRYAKHEMKGEIASCRNCKQKYVLEINDDGDLIAKIK
jgi:hypothetical protein